MTARYVFLIDISEHLKCSSSALHSRAKRMGMSVVKLGRPGTCKAASAVTPEDAKRLIEAATPRSEAVEIVSPADLMTGGDR